MTGHEWPHFTLTCDVCNARVARYQWMPEQGIWAPVATRGVLNVVIRNMRGTEPDTDWLSELERSPDTPSSSQPVREHHDIRCGAQGCRNHVAADGERLRYLFTLISLAVHDTQPTGRREWWYQLAALASPDDKGSLWMTLDQLRQALTIGNATL